MLARKSINVVRLLSRLTFPKRVHCKYMSMTPTVGSCNKKDSDQSLKRALESGPVRLAFIPEEWFLFFSSKTGVTGPYLLGLMVCNYLVSKEIYVMEHEYYSGLPWLVVLIIVMKKLAPGIARSLDKQVDDTVAEWERGRQDQIKDYNDLIKVSKDAQWRAESQKYLMDAKKENVAMQLEAIYRERSMYVYHIVKNRMDYHVAKHRALTRIHQKWMIGWIMENVKKSITPDFQKQALNKAISDLAAAAKRA